MNNISAPEPRERERDVVLVYSPPQVLQIDGRLYHLVLAFLVVGDFTNSRAPSLHGRYPASTLLRTHPTGQLTPAGRPRTGGGSRSLWTFPARTDQSINGKLDKLNERVFHLGKQRVVHSDDRAGATDAGLLFNWS